MRPTPEDLATFLRGLGDDLFLPALWLVRRSDLGAVLDFYKPGERVLEQVEDRLLTQDRRLYEFIVCRRAEN